MMWKTRPGAGVTVFVVALLLVSCREAPQPAPTQMVATADRTAEETVEAVVTKPAVERKPTVTTGTAPQAVPTGTPGTTTTPETPVADPAPGEASPYPGPDSVLGQGGTVYPAPGQEAGTGAYPGPASNPTTNPYPGPGGQAATQPAAASPTAAQPASSGGTGTATPRPSGTVPAGTASLTPTSTTTPAGTPTPVPPSATPTLSPTPTGPRPTLNVELLATDPNTVHLASGKVQLIEFFTFWCGICKAMAPVVNEVAADFDDRVNFIFLDTDNPANREFERKLNFTKEPQFFLLDGQGKVLRQWQGYVTSESFRNALNFVLQQ